MDRRQQSMQQECPCLGGMCQNQSNSHTHTIICPTQRCLWTKHRCQNEAHTVNKTRRVVFRSAHGGIIQKSCVQSNSHWEGNCLFYIPQGKKGLGAVCHVCCCAHDHRLERSSQKPRPRPFPGKGQKMHRDLRRGICFLFFSLGGVCGRIRQVNIPPESL